jgi:hypothetical protein
MRKKIILLYFKYIFILYIGKMQSPPPTEYFPGIQFNPYYYQSWYEPVTKIYLDSNYTPWSYKRGASS